MMRGHLIHIGYHKTGSTFLQQWFDAHPQIGYTYGGFAGFDDVYQMIRAAMAPDDGIRWRVTSREGLSAPTPSTGVAYPHFDGEPTLSSDEGQDAACDMLAALFPNATILIVTRGFREMVLSSYSQYVRMGGEQTLDSLIADPPTTWHPWNYDRLIGRYRQAFGRDAVVIVPYEGLRDDPAAFCRSLEKRLGLDHHPFHALRVNESLSPVELAWYPRIAAVSRRLPLRLGRWLRKLAFHKRLSTPIRLLQAVRPVQPITAALITEAVLDPMRGQAELLRDLPEYAPYAAEYLI